MNTASLLNNINYQENKPSVTVLLQTKTSKEVRIVMRKGQAMKEHKAPFPIIIELFDGTLDFGINGKSQILKKGDLIALDENIPHDLTCISDCIVRLSVSKYDSIERINATL
ncbi:cupin domain-containing protein [Confluentibacter sediminis]|uniref:cupin domain-containing protein n=1 Tax=Confluentibacter sediminis TaxID=2219045 RepID=UPI000DAB62F1|nr:cupin domain-containing protein [Confluentibacter sediminis]